MSRLERWSRLKRGEAQDSPTSPAALTPVEDDRSPSNLEADSRQQNSGEDDSAQTREPGSLDHTLPDPDTLPPGSDIKAYLVSGVSAGLRKRALRRLFAAGHYGVRDGLDDYDDDFREKLKPLADDVAERLRQWTRRRVEGDDEAPEEVSSSQGMGSDEHDAREVPPDASDTASDTDIAEEAGARSHERPG
ncbi:DUF3306 domain-containing protein [Halomonas urmiana]|uniref:DUF3306 domain-containing protein n=1 Tax=Halomonas urmiana TaxID=490901 RepID=UPI001F001ECB|nr:DUF3306 domain-containing protein [Halomonas urmiana]